MYLIGTKDIIKNSAVWNDAIKFISLKERDIIEKYLYLKDKRLALCSFILQRYCLHKKFNKPIQEFIIKKDKYGKPYLENFEYNISHDNEIVIIDWNDTQPIGIDIVYINRPINIASFKTCFTKNENESIKNKEDLLKLWCLKESYIKAVGKGLMINLNTIAFKFEDRIKIYVENKLQKDWYFDIIKYKDYWISKALERPFKLDVNNITKISLEIILG